MHALSWSASPRGPRVGRIVYLDAAAPEGRPWMWALGHIPYNNRTPPAHGYAATREEAMAAFAKSWRQE